MFMVPIPVHGTYSVNHVVRRNLFLCRAFSFELIVFFSLCVMFSFSGLYICVRIIQMFMASFMYSLLSCTTIIVNPLFVLLIINSGLLISWFLGLVFLVLLGCRICFVCVCVRLVCLI